MEVRYTPDPKSALRFSTEELRKTFVIESLFKPDEIPMIYTDVDRAIVGTAVPVKKKLSLLASRKEMSADFFCERREVGVINIGGPGSIMTDQRVHPMETKDVLYIGKGTKEIIFSSADKKNPSKFYFASYPAHKEYPAAHAKFSDAEPSKLGTARDANKRTIYKYIHVNGIKSCQLVMGMTELEEGSVWNTFPPHTHQRRTEVYMYFNLGPDALVFHIMGHPEETRHVVLREGNAVISPSWSVHAAAGTKNYAFVWAMGGENQEFGDMDGVVLSKMA